MKKLRLLIAAVLLLAIPSIASGPVLFNTSGTPGTPISANGTYCQIGTGANGLDGIVNVAYLFTTGAGVSAGTLTFQELGPDGTWRSLVSPAAITLTATATFNGTFNGPFHAVRISIASLAGGNVTYAELKGF